MMRVIPFSKLVRVSVAFVSAAPEGSLTTPESVAVVVAICPLIHGVLSAISTSRIAIPPQLHRDRCLRLLSVFTLQPPSGHSPLGPELFSAGALHLEHRLGLGLVTGNLCRRVGKCLLRSLRYENEGLYGIEKLAFTANGCRFFRKDGDHYL